MPRHIRVPKRRIGVAVILTAASWLWLVIPQMTRRHAPEGVIGSRKAQIATALLPVQAEPKTRLAKGKLLVAAEYLGDPNFAETVVLLADYNEKGAMGLILNRATGVKLSELLPQIESLKQRDDPIYEGGPVERAEILMLVQSPHEPEHSQLIFDDVYLSSSADLLKRLANETGDQQTPFRVYSGYAGWAPEQLEAEVEAGAWHVFPATQDLVFATRTQDLWHNLIRRTTLRLAFARPTSGARNL